MNKRVTGIGGIFFKAKDRKPSANGMPSTLVLKPNPKAILQFFAGAIAKTLNTKAQLSGRLLGKIRTTLVTAMPNSC